MAEPLKNVYNEAFFSTFTKALGTVLPELNVDNFLTSVYVEDWESKELKQRMYHLSEVLQVYLAPDFKKASEQIVQLVRCLQQKGEEMSFEYMFLPDYIEKYGLQDYKTSMETIEEVTKFTSCEFAIRPFIIKYPDKTLKQMISWSYHTNAMVRRLASEGARPRLPWAIALPVYKEDPTPILPILENLITDPSETVRRSVANNLNDIAKDNPDVVINITRRWKGKSKETDWVLKHANRTLLKSGHKDALELFGFGSIKKIKIEGFNIQTPQVKIGESLEFSFQLTNLGKASALIRLEYGIYFKKANASLSRKVFKISEKEYISQKCYQVDRKQSFKIITTRKLYPGQHQVSLIINGQEQERYDFELLS